VTVNWGSTPAVRSHRPGPARSGRSALKLEGDLWALSSAGREQECTATRLRHRKLAFGMLSPT